LYFEASAFKDMKEKLALWIPILFSHNFETVEVVFGEGDYYYTTVKRS
jgi:hypothetical protein